MAEFLNQPKPIKQDYGDESGYDAMGKAIPFFRQEAAYKVCQSIGLEKENAHSAVSLMSEALSRDEPYNALKAGMKYLDLTGTYRIMAVLLTAKDEM